MRIVRDRRVALFARKTPAAHSIEVPVGFDLPAKTRWGYMPGFQNRAMVGALAGKVLTGTELGPLVTLHHDAANAEMTIRAPEGAENGLDIEFNSFAGSFASLAFGLPEQGIRGLGRNDLLRLSIRTQTDVPFKAYARLNLIYGPNSEQITRMIEIGQDESFAEFDIFYSSFDPDRASDAWIDLIFNDPANRRIVLSDVVILRRVRASL